MVGTCDSELRQSKRIKDVTDKKKALSASDRAEDHGEDLVGSSQAPVDDQDPVEDQAVSSDDSVEDPYSWMFD